MVAFRLSPSNPYSWSIYQANSPLYLQAILFPIFMALGLQLSDVQRLKARFRRTETLVRIIFGLGIGTTAFILLHALVHFQLVGRYIIIISVSFGIISSFLSRSLLWRLARTRARQVLFWGERSDATDCLTTLLHANVPISVIGYYLKGQLSSRSLPSLAHENTPSPNEHALAHFQTPPPDQPLFTDQVSLELHEIYTYCQANQIERVLLSNPTSLSLSEKRELTHLISKGLKVQTLNDFFERELERVHVTSVDERWLWDHEPTSTSPYYLGLKRLTDILLSLLGLICSIPFFPMIAFLIWIQDRGPILYSQERLGLYGVPFRIYKFRTMRVDAESSGAQWAQRGDQRITRLGRFLRKSRFDEIPQFYNILRGDMSFVGPRPEREELAKEIEASLPHFRFRQLAKPGLSGWAQINHGYSGNVEEARVKLSYDLYYLKHASIALDLLIVLRTFGAMMRGAR